MYTHNKFLATRDDYHTRAWLHDSMTVSLFLSYMVNLIYLHQIDVNQ